MLGFDPQTRAKLWACVTQFNREQNLTVFFITHHLEEVERFAKTITIIDHGKIVIQGMLQEVRQSVKAQTLEEAFLTLTGYSIREDESSAIDWIRTSSKFWK